jgi:hypothetical protein
VVEVGGGKAARIQLRLPICRRQPAKREAQGQQRDRRIVELSGDRDDPRY